jgi:hypothetical protein
MSGPLRTYLDKRVDHVLPLAHSSPPKPAAPSSGSSLLFSSSCSHSFSDKSFKGGDADAGGPLAISVLTYNVWFDLDDWQLRFDAVASIIERLQPTVHIPHPLPLSCLTCSTVCVCACCVLCMSIFVYVYVCVCACVCACVCHCDCRWCAFRRSPSNSHWL